MLLTRPLPIEFDELGKDGKPFYEGLLLYLGVDAQGTTHYHILTNKGELIHETLDNASLKPPFLVKEGVFDMKNLCEQFFKVTHEKEEDEDYET